MMIVVLTHDLPTFSEAAYKDLTISLNKYDPYTNDTKIKLITESWDMLQREFECCGIGYNQDDEEYEETKKDTLEQLKDFNNTLSKMKEGDISLVDELNRIQLVMKL